MSESAEPLPYGPETPRVRRFLERLAQQEPRGWLAAARLYVAAQAHEALAHADAALAVAVTRTGRERARDAVVGPVVQLARAAVARAATAPRPLVADEEALAEAALAAALALIVRDVLADEDFAALYRPFEQVIPVAALAR